MAVITKAQNDANLRDLQNLRLDKDVIILDTETTGFGRGAEVLELGMIDGTGAVLWDERYKPLWNESWDDAQEIHGITPEAVMEKDSLWIYMPEIRAMLKGKTVIIFNSVYDSGIMPDGITTPAVKLCAMRAFKLFTGSKKYNLKLAAETFAGYEFAIDEQHTAIGDCRATLAVAQWMQAERDTFCI